MNHMAVLRRISLTAATVGIAVVLSACGQADSTTPARADTPATAMADMPGMNAASSGKSASSKSNQADIAFVQRMIPDHQMVAKMSKLAQQRAASTELKTLATQMRKGQAQTTGMMQDMLTGWGKTASADMAGMQMAGTMSKADMAMLKSMKGMDFDMMFAQMMIKHHQASIKMARQEQAKGANAEAKTMAAAMVTKLQTQVKELDQITQM